MSQSTAQAAAPGAKLSWKTLTIRMIAFVCILLVIDYYYEDLSEMVSNILVINWDGIYGYTLPWIIPVVVIVTSLALIKRGWLGKVGLVLGLLIIAWNFHGMNFYDPRQAGVRTVDTLCGDHEIDRVGQARPGLKKFVGGPDRKFADALKGFGSDDAARQNDCDAALARVTRKIPVKRQPWVNGWSQAAQTYFTAYEPILVTFSPDDIICTGSRPHECSNAEGIRKAPLEGLKTVVQVRQHGGDPSAPQGNYGALIARMGSGGLWHFPGLTFAVCGTGNVQFWTNRYGKTGPLVDTEDFVRSTGAYTFEATADDPIAISVCRNNPGAEFVPINNLP